MKNIICIPNLYNLENNEMYEENNEELMFPAASEISVENINSIRYERNEWNEASNNIDSQSNTCSSFVSPSFKPIIKSFVMTNNYSYDALTSFNDKKDMHLSFYQLVKEEFEEAFVILNNDNKFRQFLKRKLCHSGNMKIQSLYKEIIRIHFPKFITAFE